MHIDEAEDAIYLCVAADDLLEDESLEALAAADDRGETIFVETSTPEAKTRLHEAVPDARVTVPDSAFAAVADDSEKPGRLLMVDRKTILMSALRDGFVPREKDETGVWGSKVGHGLVVWMRQLLVDRIGRLEFETTTGEW